MPTKIEKDALTGRETTGHDWDGVRELNTPLPKWWLYTLLATVVWAVALVVLYPAIPLGRTHTAGLLGYTTRGTLAAEIRAEAAERAPVFDRIRAETPAQIEKDPDLRAVALIDGKSAFANNCAPCHGPSGEGRIGYPNLQDDVWLWGGTLDQIQATITHGARSGDPKDHESDMPRFGADHMLTEPQMNAVADYVWALYGGRPLAGTEAGAKLFADNCALCHGDKGQGNQQVGAPPLHSATHLYTPSRDAILSQIHLPREGVMPAWGGRLDPATIKSLAIYVHSLGGGQ